MEHGHHVYDSMCKFRAVLNKNKNMSPNIKLKTNLVEQIPPEVDPKTSAWLKVPKRFVITDYRGVSLLL